MKIFVRALVLGLLVGSGAVLAQQPPSGSTPPQIEGFVPVDSLPPSEQLPAARLLIAAYAFVWVAIFVYIWALWRRLSKVEGELQLLAKKTGPPTR